MCNCRALCVTWNSMYLSCDYLWQSNERVLFIINPLFRSCLLIMLVLIYLPVILEHTWSLATLNEFTVTSSFADFSFLSLYVVTHALKLPNDKCPDMHYEQYRLHNTGFVTSNCTSYWLFHLNRLLQRSWITKYVVKKEVNTSIYYNNNNNNNNNHYNLLYAGYSLLIILRKTMSLGTTVMQLFCCYCSGCLYLWFPCWICCTFTLALSEVCVQCPIWLISVVPWLHVFPVCC